MFYGIIGYKKGLKLPPCFNLLFNQAVQAWQTLSKLPNFSNYTNQKHFRLFDDV